MEHKIGDTFGRLTIIDQEFIYIGTHRRKMWVCRCICGKIKRIHTYNLRQGQTQSCGCLHREIASSVNRTHGLSKTPTYKTWSRMHRRCDNKKDEHHWKHYGGRGIKVCERWKSFEAFLEDMGESPSSKHSIDRIDRNGDYTPVNCRWATHLVQMRNTTRNRYVTMNGETHCLKEWCELLEMNYFTMVTRIRRGWDAAKALSTPIAHKHRFSS